MINAHDLQQNLDNAMHLDAGEQEMAQAGLKAFFHFTEEWRLNEEQRKALLGCPKKSRYYDLKKGASHNITADERDRLAYLGGIYIALQILYPVPVALQWLNNTTREPGLWHHHSPLEHMVAGRMEGIIDVYRYLNHLRGAN